VLIRLTLIASLAAASGFAFAAADDLEARAAALRAELAVADASKPSARVAMERQLLTSIERRLDLARTRADTLASEVPDGGSSRLIAGELAPLGLLEADDLRRLSQELDLAIDAGTRRLALARADREAAAARLVQAVAHVRELEDGGSNDADVIARAKLETELAESATAELDAIVAVVEVEQQSERAQRDAIAQRLATKSTLSKPTPDEIAVIDRRLAKRSSDLDVQLADAIRAREEANADVVRESASASPERAKALKERLTTRDIEIELVREATANLALERAAWQFAIRYWRDGDLEALAEARERGPVVRESLSRRLDFMGASFEQFAAQSGTLGTRLTESPEAVDAPEWRERRAALDERMRLIERGMLDQRRVIALIDRLRIDFDARIGSASAAERAEFAWDTAKRFVARIWNLELFVVDQSVEVNGRETRVPRSITVEKVIKAPLLLLVSLFLAHQLTRLVERRAVKRGIEPANARLARRWTFGLLACACALASLAIAGIPFAAFAFVGGAVAIGVGFGMQTLFKNLISGVLVLIERPFRLGDEIQIGELRGTVVDIDLRASVLRDADGSETLIPNATLVEQNVTSRARMVRQTIVVTVEPGSDPRAVADALRSAAERHGLLTESKKPEVFLDEFPGAGLRFSMNYWIEPGPGVDRQRIASDLRLMILNAFNDAGIALAKGALDLRLIANADEAKRTDEAVAVDPR
jgi:small-conductance mechanosensitive channel